MVCLESDMHLAEVAACHEILSLVLVKPAEIDAASKQRMYTLINQSAAATAAAAPLTATPVAAPVATPVGDDKVRRREVPDYLREPETVTAAKVRRGWVMAAAAAVALFLVAAAAVLALMPPDELPGFLQPIARLLHPQPVAVKPDDATKTKPDVEVTVVTPPAATPTGTLKQPDSVTVVAAPAGTGTTVVVTGTGGTTELRQPTSAVSTSADTVPRPTGTAPLPPSPGDSTTTVTVTQPSVFVVPLPAATATGTAPAPSAVTVVTTPATTATTTVVAVPAKIEPVGRVSSAVSQVLLRFDGTANAWVRLPAREQLMVGDRLLALPDFRPQIALSNGLTIDVLGGTLLELRPIDATGTPGVLLLRGRIMMFTVGGAKASLRLEGGGPATTVSLSTAELGVEFVPLRQPGADPMAPTSTSLLALYAKSGQIGSATGPGPEMPLAAPGSYAMAQGAAPIAITPAVELPGWLSTDDRDMLRRQAADFVETRLRGDKAVSVVLREILSDKPPRMEHIQLALESLAQIGEFADFVPLLRDPTQRESAWDRYLGILQRALDFGPTYAAEIGRVFVTQHGPPGEGQYRMLWGFNDEQLKAGAAKMLVELLDHEELDFRVVASWTLTETTGLRLGYLPQDPPLKRKPNIQKWQQKLEAGQIVRKKLP
jgi:hypothetical protein